MDADRRIIPLVDDDQGEGVRDPLTMDDILDLEFDATREEHRKELFKNLIGDVFDKTMEFERVLGYQESQPKRVKKLSGKEFNKHLPDVRSLRLPGKGKR